MSCAWHGAPLDADEFGALIEKSVSLLLKAYLLGCPRKYPQSEAVPTQSAREARR